MRSVCRKLRGRRGASITFALLLFLVCAVVGSVVLTAGTAASGRLSRLPEQDRRYYAVTSAAGLFRDALDGQSYTVTRTLTTLDADTLTRVYDSSQGEPVLLSETTNTQTGLYPAYSATLRLPDGTSGPLGTEDRAVSLLADAILTYVFGPKAEGERFDTEAAWNAAPGGALPEPWTMTLRPTDESLGDGLDVDVTAELRADGALALTFVNADAGGDRFTLTLTMTAQVNDDSDTPAKGSAAVTPTDPEYGQAPVGGTVNRSETQYEVTTVQKTRQTQTKTTTITWTAGDVRKGAAA